MAFKEVVLTEEEQKSGGGRKFKKFDAIGDKHLGLFVRTVKETANYADGPKDVVKFIFWNRTDGEFEVTPPMDLDKKLKKAMKPESEGGCGLIAGGGHLVMMSFTSTRAIEGRADPMKLFTVKVDTAPDAKLLVGVPADVLHAKKSGGASSTGTEDDIPF